MRMKNRSYNQLCGLAYALDVIGDRWTILIIRELFPGPRRFKDLMDWLPGVSTNLLTKRLKHLEQQGLLIRRVLPPPAGSTVYELTKLGLSLKETLLELGKWGSQFVPESMEGTHVLRLGSYALTPQTFFRPELAQGVNETYLLHIGEEVQQVRIADREITVAQQDPQNVSQEADVALYADVPVYLGLMTGQIALDAALLEELIRIEGNMEALHRFLAICGVSSPT